MLTLHLGKVMMVLANLMYTYLGETEARKLLKTCQIFSPNGGSYLLCHFVASAYIVHQLKSELCYSWWVNIMVFHMLFL
jgi:hypothetical protein